MKRKTFASIMMVSLILLSGCSGILPGGGNNPGDGTSTAGEPTTTAAGDEIVPGVTQDSVDIAKLVSGHRNNIQSESFTFERLVQLSETQGAEQKVSIKYEPTENGFQSISKTTGGSQSTGTYYESSQSGKTMYTKVTQGNETIYRSGDTSQNRMLTRVTQSGFVIQWANFFNFEVSENSDTVVLTSTSVKDKERLAQSAGVQSIEDASFKIVVNKNTGIIKSYEMSIKGTDRKVSLTGTFSKVGQTTVDKPSWYDTAEENAIEMSVSASDDNTHLVVDYKQGVTIPKGTLLYLGLGSEGLSQAEAGVALEPGNTYYIVPPQTSDGTAKIVAEKPSGDLNKLKHDRYFVAFVNSDSRLLYYQTEIKLGGGQTPTDDGSNTTTDSHDGHDHDH